MLKVAVVILTVLLAYAAIYSLMALIVPKVILKSSIQASIGKTIDNAQNDGYLRALTVVMINLGGLGDMTNMTLHIIGVVVFLVGLLLPVKIFFRKAA